ncbi:hypothetical protein FOL47_000918 [Perkinsus chesapeaki]|uniref:Uncharacterized protein n=1 Tax=Perkinsus chesapeaki TaxID=330153 RepID=A0A7J6N279_PERCH|nr:hypothetical protein FOL47_000918 [Perkinsus chesapeaki]
MRSFPLQPLRAYRWAPRLVHLHLKAPLLSSNPQQRCFSSGKETFDAVLQEMAKRKDTTTGTEATAEAFEGEDRAPEEEPTPEEEEMQMFDIDDEEMREIAKKAQPLSERTAEDVRTELQSRLDRQVPAASSATEVDVIEDDGSEDDVNPEQYSDDEEEQLTPAQRFYLENKERLLERATSYYMDKAKQEEEEDPDGIVDSWRFYRDPVVRPPKGHMWNYKDSGRDSLPEEEYEPIQLTEGEMPTIEQITRLLQDEQALDITVVDLDLVGRRDVGMWAIIATVQSGGHGRRLGSLCTRTIEELKIPGVMTSMNGRKADDWVIARVGEVVIHLMTKTRRERMNLEALLMRPHDWMGPEDFPQYTDFWDGSEPPDFVSRSSKGVTATVEDQEKLLKAFDNENDYDIERRLEIGDLGDASDDDDDKSCKTKG